MDALHQARRGGIDFDASEWAFQKALLKHLAQIWNHPDEGMWEVRGPRQHFTFSKVMAWVAFDRAIKTASTFGRDGPIEHWRAIKNAIRVGKQLVNSGVNQKIIERIAKSIPSDETTQESAA